MLDTTPSLRDRLQRHPFDRHYFYQDAWALRRIFRVAPEIHVDVGSSLQFVAALSSLVPVCFVDIRAPQVTLSSFFAVRSSILRLPFADNSLSSVSCLHVAEHIGLGRYGDGLEVHGTLKAARELSRALSPGGDLFFSVPVGAPRLCFNAHRIHSPLQILGFFSDLELVEFSGIDDEARLHEGADPCGFKGGSYGCGLFWFRKPLETSSGSVKGMRTSGAAEPPA